MKVLQVADRLKATERALQIQMVYGSEYVSRVCEAREVR